MWLAQQIVEAFPWEAAENRRVHGEDQLFSPNPNRYVRGECYKGRTDDHRLWACSCSALSSSSHLTRYFFGPDSDRGEVAFHKMADGIRFLKSAFARLFAWQEGGKKGKPSGGEVKIVLRSE
jgi:hypothetical protein